MGADKEIGEAAGATPGAAGGKAAGAGAAAPGKAADDGVGAAAGAAAPGGRAAAAGAHPAAAVVFDCDGLLVDSAGCWRLAFERVLAADGRSLQAGLLASLSGASVGAAAAALGVAREDLRGELSHTFRTGPLRARPGAHELLAWLHGRLPMAVASNAPRELVALALRRAGLSAHLPIVLSADALPERLQKPAPHVYLAACERLGVAPHRAVAFEDSPLGAAAVRAAGLRLVYIPSAEAGEVPADLQAERLDDDAVLALFAGAGNGAMSRTRPGIAGDPGGDAVAVSALMVVSRGAAAGRR